MTYAMQQYDNALERILREGVWKSSKRTGVRTKALCGVTCRYPLERVFPVMTRRKVWPRSIFAELLWFLSGSTNKKDLQALNSNIWNSWGGPEFEGKHGYVDGALGPIYGFQLRHFGGKYGNGDPKDPFYGQGGFDQMADIMTRLKADPTDRRLLFSLWHPASTKSSSLPPCHLYYQLFVDDDGMLTGFMNQRSADFPVGVPANIQFYSALTCMIAKQAGLVAKEFVHTTVDSHIYEDQIPAVEEYLATPVIDSPRLILYGDAPDIFSYKMSDFCLDGFFSGPKIDIPVAV